MNTLSCIILAAGKGTRMKSDKPKVMNTLAGWPLIRHVVKTCEELGSKNIITVIAPGMDDVAAEVSPHKTAIQVKQMGTADAAKSALPFVDDSAEYVLIALGDVPLISTDTFDALVESATETGLSVLVTDAIDPTGYGRVITEDFFATAIVEDRDCTAEQARITLINAGCFCVAAKHLQPFLSAIQSNNSQKEYYLTDIVAVAAEAGVRCVYVEAPIHEVMGINSRSQLAEAEGELQNYLRARAMHDGATLVDPLTTYFAMDTKLGRDVTVEPGVFFGPGVTVADNVMIHAFSHLEGVTIESGASIGPFARIRPHSHIGENATVGNFIEVNRSTMKAGSKSKHLSYLGDAIIGEKSNIGAGTVIANYDGFDKQQTEIGKGVFIGSNSTLIAPLKVGDGAYVGAASAINADVPAESLALARARTVIRDGWATLFRSEKQANKSKKAG